MGECQLTQENIAEWEIYFEKHQTGNNPYFGIGTVDHALDQRVGLRRICFKETRD